MAWDDWVFGIPTAGGYNAVKALTSPGELSPDEQARKKALEEQAAKAGGFADSGQLGFSQLGGEAAGVRDYLGRVARGEESVAAEQLRQGLQQNQAAQRSMAAGASAQNAPMMARTAMMNSQRMGSALAGQQALAGIAERRAAQESLAQMLMQQRQQELSAALGSRQNALTGFGAGQPFVPQPTQLQQLMGAAQGAASLYGTAQGGGKKPF